MSICVLGLGYVGLTLAVTLAKVSSKVYGIDVMQEKIEKLQKGIPTVFEPGLESLLKKVINEGSFIVSDSITPEIAKDVDTYIICIGTPIDNFTKKPVLEHVKKIINELSNILKKNDLVILRSTVTVGTANNVVKKTLEEKTGFKLGKDFFLASAPERTVEGNALNELRQLPQIIGSSNEQSVDRAANIFNKITKTVIRMESFESAEVVKLLDNTSRDVNIALGNLYGLLCEKLGLPSKEIIEAANYAYPRNRIFVAGAGVGGQCLVKDPYFLIESVKGLVDTSFIKTAREINDSMPNHVTDLIKEAFEEMNKEIINSKVLILGFAFKGIPATDDIRYSPTLPILEFLKEKNARILGFDPNVKNETILNLGVTPTQINDVKDIDCIIIMNNNKQFSEINYQELMKKSNGKVAIVDGWQMIDASDAQKIGFTYRGVGTGFTKKS